MTRPICSPKTCYDTSITSKAAADPHSGGARLEVRPVYVTTVPLYMLTPERERTPTKSWHDYGRGAPSGRVGGCNALQGGQ